MILWFWRLVQKILLVLAMMCLISKGQKHIVAEISQFNSFQTACTKRRANILWQIHGKYFLVELLQRLVVVFVNNLVNVLLLQQTSVSLTSTLARVGHLWEVQAPASVAGILTGAYFLSNFFLRKAS